MTVKVIDLGARRVVSAARRNKKPAHVDVGVLGKDAGKAKAGESGLTVGQVAEWAELGLGQPQRSWLRGWIDANEDAINRRMDSEMESVILGERTPDQALARLGVWLQGEVQKNIADFPSNDFEPNAPATIKGKGSSSPLINTGQLRSSISHRVGSGE
jgi:hypothetical protein